MIKFIPLRGVQVDRAGQSEVFEDERHARSGDRVRLVEKPQMEVRTFGRPGIPQFGDGAPVLTASPTFTVMLPWRKCAYQAKTFGAI